MDLYNNELGRAIAVANPDASPEELVDLVQAAVTEGHTVVIGPDGLLDFSDQVRPEDTGDPRETELPGHPQPAAEKINSLVGSTVLRPDSYLYISGALAVFVKDGEVVKPVVVREMVFDGNRFSTAAVVERGRRLTERPTGHRGR